MVSGVCVNPNRRRPRRARLELLASISKPVVRASPAEDAKNEPSTACQLHWKPMRRVFEMPPVSASTDTHKLTATRAWGDEWGGNKRRLNYCDTELDAESVARTKAGKLPLTTRTLHDDRCNVLSSTTIVQQR